VDTLWITECYLRSNFEITVVHSLHLPYGSSGDGADPVVISPESAGWGFAGLRIVELPPDGSRTLQTGSDEMLVLPLTGSASVACAGSTFELAGRADVFSGPTDFVYLPIGSEATISTRTGGRFALPSARATRPRSPAYGPAAAVPVELRGAGRASRQLNNFCDPLTFATDKLVAVECLTPAGNWSSWPPHKHDTAAADEAVLEEIYYYEMAPSDVEGGRRMGEGFAMQRLYTTDGEIDLCEEVRHGDAVLIPRGYHGPSMTAPGYDLYYLNVLAGPGAERTMAFHDDPAHHWIRATWEAEAVDPRLPIGTGETT
jgi:5-deoxy-glucuronate isomerase